MKKKGIHSKLAEHKHIGKRLIPPLMTIPQVSMCSWAWDRLPEYIWASLIRHSYKQETACEIFKEIAEIGFRYRDTPQSNDWGLAHTTLADQETGAIKHICKIIEKYERGLSPLRPLLLYDYLPAKDQWERALQVSPEPSDWQVLGDTVAECFDAQSQESTDIRWLIILTKMASGCILFQKEQQVMGEEIVGYPYKGNLRKVRPTIRAMEMSFSSAAKNKLATGWNKLFWDENLEKTGCSPYNLTESKIVDIDIKSTLISIAEVLQSTLETWAKLLTTTGTDAKHASSFGICFYCICLLVEMLHGKNRVGITGRLILRTLTECNITLAYLSKYGTEYDWIKFRDYGIGQAKLALLKLEEAADDLPKFVSLESLKMIVNDDKYQEYVIMDFGNWNNSDLRKMAAESETKDIYDKYYCWTSSFVHGQWGSIRDACMCYCVNPLHRYHRIPMPSHRTLDDASEDAVYLVNRALNILDCLYPGNNISRKLKLRIIAR